MNLPRGQLLLKLGTNRFAVKGPPALQSRASSWGPTLGGASTVSSQKDDGMLRVAFSNLNGSCILPVSTLEKLPEKLVSIR